MSLSFVSSAVLSSTDGVSHNEEKPIESTETQSLRSSAVSGAARPLFDQLRANRDAEQEKRDEAAKALRGTRTLDEEDCAHLDAVDRVRMEREARMRDEVEDEVAAFRAARADRRAAGSGDTPKGGEDRAEEAEAAECPPVGGVAEKEAAAPRLVTTPSLASITPKIIAKKRRRRQKNQAQQEGASTSADERTKRPRGDFKASSAGASSGGSARRKGENAKGDEGGSGDEEEEKVGGLGGLLGGYRSDSADSDSA